MSLTERSDHIKLLSKIGSGEYGVVYIGRDESRNGRIVAVKKFRAAGQSQSTLYRELSIQQRLDCNHIVRVEDVVCLAEKSVLILEYVPLTLSCLIDAHLQCSVENQFEYHMPREVIVKIFRGIIEACSYLHARRIMHRDLSPNNILVRPFDDDSLSQWANGDKRLLQDFIHGGLCCTSQRCREHADQIYRQYVRPTLHPCSPSQHDATQTPTDPPSVGDTSLSPPLSSRGPSESSRSPSVPSDEFPWASFNPVVKVADFGVARFDGKGLAACALEMQRVHTERSTTFAYAAPEVMLLHEYGTAADMFSAGCILYELATGRVLISPNDLHSVSIEAAKSCRNSPLSTPPMDVPAKATDYVPLCYWMRMFQVLGSPTEDEWATISSHTVFGQPAMLARDGPKFPRETFTAGSIVNAIGADGCDLLRRLLAYDPKLRISAADALSHPFLA